MKTKSQIGLLLFLGIAILCPDECVGRRHDDESNEHTHYLQNYTPSLVPDRIVLTWKGDPARSQAVTWRTSQGVQSAVAEIVAADPGPDFESNASRLPATTSAVQQGEETVQFHTVEFTGLEPDSQYLYRVGSTDHWSEWCMFQTAKTETAPFSFIYFGDAQNDVKSKWSRVVRQAFRSMPEASFLLHAGDLVNRANSDHEWGQWFYSAGWINRNISVIATPGNHEYDRGLSQYWRPTFAFPEHGPPGLEETVYYIDYQGTRIISLNSNADIPSQVKWLREVLGNNTNRWTIVTLHHPLFSSAEGRDNVGLRNHLQPVFDEFSVDLVLQGHDHTYARSSAITADNMASGVNKRGEGGTVYVVSVSGPKMYSAQSRPIFSRIAEGTQLYQLITVEHDQLTYRAMTATGAPYDGFALHKPEDGGPNTFEEQIPDTPERRKAVTPLEQAHSHNDYYQSQPLLHALDNGFCSVEADIFLENGQLLIGHDQSELRSARTLDDLYLQPLWKRYKANGGRIFPESDATFTLLIDFKSDSKDTYKALKTVLAVYADMLTRYDSGQRTEGAVTVIISGNRPIEQMANESKRLAALDGRLSDLSNDVDNNLMPLISDRWSNEFSWNGQGEFPTEEKQRLSQLVQQAHSQGKRIRFWAVPDMAASWQILHDAGVDYINTDKVAELAKFLQSRN